MFSFRNFQEQLKTPLDRLESKFLVKTFSTACGFFFFFAFLVWSVGAVISSIFSSFGWLFGGFCSFIGWIMTIPLHLCSIRYRNDPLGSSQRLVTATYVSFVSCFLFLFLGITSICWLILGSGSGSNTMMAKLLFYVFGITIAIYSVPAAIAFTISKKTTIINLDKFLWYCVLCYIFVAIVGFFMMFFVLNLVVYTAINVIFAVLGILILFLSPVITIYRMRTIVPYINYDDAEETKRWENYFVFEISFQLLQLALHVLRIVVYFLTSVARSRLK